MDLAYSLAGAFVGFLVGLTGVGGGSLMAPILIILFGFNPAVAIGTDLWFAAITKSIGGTIHHKLGSPDWQVVRRLALGSLPAAALTVLWLAHSHEGRLESDLLMQLLGAMLLLTAVLMLAKPRLTAPLRKFADRMNPEMRKRQALATMAAGALVGVLVTLTSVGAGALVAVMLALLYPLRLGAKTIVGTDIIHAVPLTLVAAIGHSWLGNVDIWLLASLLIGSIPGIVAGSLVAGKVNDGLVRWALAAMLAVSAVKMMAS
ncbi:sulfite exporter TauE/SafE family protein [Alteraurantiacibacter aquimixticola]|uniref:Probable membrane transporter protein n=1 Tax=Alteraurantiacibacter aquimixticola TaxID=2489173 RepID=A0A4T3EYF6_9SPHN|nr:sulfite exporter TauE/SafE family protein [Alteraurantiacibacter aquimixticola]TIX49689.1 sulfite exporter TauE/SafE family protein [Alteraurantiacibacter aquimixticola]